LRLSGTGSSLWLLGGGVGRGIREDSFSTDDFSEKVSVAAVRAAGVGGFGWEILTFLLILRFLVSKRSVAPSSMPAIMSSSSGGF
jgi:hypothetical protein